MTLIAQSGATIGSILVTMAVVACIETVVPLHRWGRSSRAHLGPNLALTFITFGTNVFMNLAVVAGLMLLGRLGFGILNALRPPPLLSAAAAVLGLDCRSTSPTSPCTRFLPSGASTSFITATPSSTSPRPSGNTRVRASSATRSWRRSRSCWERAQRPSPSIGRGRPSMASWSTRTSGSRVAR